MSDSKPVIAYLFTTFPKSTETFLQREIIAMRDKGDKHGVVTAQLWAVNQRSEKVLSCEFSLLIRRERLLAD